MKIYVFPCLVFQAISEYNSYHYLACCYSNNIWRFIIPLCPLFFYPVTQNLYVCYSLLLFFSGVGMEPLDFAVGDKFAMFSYLITHQNIFLILRRILYCNPYLFLKFLRCLRFLSIIYISSFVGRSTSVLHQITVIGYFSDPQLICRAILIIVPRNILTAYIHTCIHT